MYTYVNDFHLRLFLGDDVLQIDAINRQQWPVPPRLGMWVHGLGLEGVTGPFGNDSSNNISIFGSSLNTLLASIRRQLAAKTSKPTIRIARHPLL